MILLQRAFLPSAMQLFRANNQEVFLCQQESRVFVKGFMSLFKAMCMLLHIRM